MATTAHVLLNMTVPGTWPNRVELWPRLDWGMALRPICGPPARPGRCRKRAVGHRPFDAAFNGLMMHAKSLPHRNLVERHQIGVPAVDRLARNASSEQRAVQIDDALESVAARGAAKSPAWTLLTDASR